MNRTGSEKRAYIVVTIGDDCITTHLVNTRMDSPSPFPDTITAIFISKFGH